MPNSLCTLFKLTYRVSKLSGTQNIVGMLRDQEKRNAFSPVNSPEKREYQFMDIAQMAAATGTQPVLVDEIFGKQALTPFVLLEEY